MRLGESTRNLLFSRIAEAQPVINYRHKRRLELRNAVFEPKTSPDGIILLRTLATIIHCTISAMFSRTDGISRYPARANVFSRIFAKAPHFFADEHVLVTLNVLGAMKMDNQSNNVTTESAGENLGRAVINTDIMFSNHKNVFKPSIAKHQRKLLEKIRPIEPFLEQGEKSSA
jgi:hypothetical protein